jgi:hypothetical protein
VYERTNKLSDEEKVLNDAIDIYRDEESRNPDFVGSMLVDALIRMASLRKKNGQLKEEEEALIEAKSIVEPLLNNNPNTYSQIFTKITEGLVENRKLSSELKP